MESFAIHKKSTRMLFFWIGITATFVYRLIIVLNHFDPLWVQIAWYIGTIGFVLYFIHRFQVSEKRAKIILEYDLLGKIDATSLPENDKQAFRYIISSLRSSKERWNYIFIFTLSGLALLYGVFTDFIIR